MHHQCNDDNDDDGDDNDDDDDDLDSGARVTYWWISACITNATMMMMTILVPG